MKKLLLSAAIAAILASCAAPRNISVFLDYSPLTNAGLYASPSNVVPDGYTAIGQVLILQQDGYKKEYNKDSFNESQNGLFDRNKSGKSSSRVEYNYNTILTELTDNIRQQGGDGVVGLSVERINNELHLSGYIIKKK